MRNRLGPSWHWWIRALVALTVALTLALGALLAWRLGVVLGVQLTAYLVATLCAGMIAYWERPGRAYYPAMKLLAAMIFAVLGHVLTIYTLSFIWPNLRSDPVQLVARSLGMAGVLVWTAALTYKRNRTPASRQLTLVGQEKPISDDELAHHQEAVERTGQRHGRFDYDAWYARLRSQQLHRQMTRERRTR